ncbi:LysE family translocator [Kitasatospora sp. NPDC088351]|uniref:LysE family translocator n=1 Tax=Kitasatospora sp. NPDC088351 TaxID=3155180 RepID=UPI0034175BC7
MTALAGFALFALLITIAPGPDTLLVLRNCMRGGRASGAATALGSAAGSLVWAVFAALGLAAVLQRWDTAFTVVRLAGAAYLVFLGAQALWRYRPGKSTDGTPADAAPTSAPTPAPTAARAFRQGLLSCLLNPKVGVFFVAVVPQFLPDGKAGFATTMLFGVVDAVIAGAWLLTVAVVATRALTWLRRPRVHRALERTTGGVLLALGIGTAVESA